MLLDIVLPDENGVAVVESIPTLSPRIPFILLGGAGEYDSNVMHRTFPVLQKPFTAQQLMRCTKAAIARFYLDQRQSINMIANEVLYSPDAPLFPFAYDPKKRYCGIDETFQRGVVTIMETYQPSRVWKRTMACFSQCG